MSYSVAGSVKTKGYPSKAEWADTMNFNQNAVINFGLKDIGQTDWSNVVQKLASNKLGKWK